MMLTQAHRTEVQDTKARLEERQRELDRLNLFLEGILGNLGLAVVVLDAEQRVQIWNAAAQDLWGMRPEEVEGLAFSALDIGLPVAQLAEGIGQALADPPSSSEAVLAAVNRKGRDFTCVVRTLSLGDANGNRHGVILLMGEHDSDGAPSRGGSQAPVS